MDDHLGVCMRAKDMSLTLQFRPQIGEVVDFSIEDDENSTVFVENRLVTARQVNDAEPPHAQAHAIFDKNAFVVWPAMHDLLTHLMNQRLFHTAARCAHDPGNSTHKLYLSRTACSRTAA